jgi:hypothetical protein
MSQLSRGIFGVIAVSLTFGVVQLASGRDLVNRPFYSLGLQNPAGTLDGTVNRAAKADRPGRVAGSAMPSRTIALKLIALSDTSILVRMPVAKLARKGSFAPSLTKPGDGKMAVACEPVVSILTEVAKQLQPGRCVT